MKIFNKPVSSLLLSFLIFLPVVVFAVDSFGKKDEGIIFQAGRNVYLKYADQDKNSFGKNDHPVELDNEEIRKTKEDRRKELYIKKEERRNKKGRKEGRTTEERRKNEGRRGEDRSKKQGRTRNI